jgi:hypothetical protein
VNNSPQIAQLKSYQHIVNNRPQSSFATQMQQMVKPPTADSSPVDEATAENVLQKKGVTVQPQANKTGLPDQLKSGIEHLSGFALDDVRVHYNSSQPAQLQAHAFAKGSEIHVAAGQEQHLAHEAWHIVQQKQGRVQATTQLKGDVDVNDDAGLEHEADVMGAKALSTLDRPSNNLKASGEGGNIIQNRNSEQLIANAEISNRQSIQVNQSSVVQRAVDTNGGTWDTSSYAVVADGAEITIDFAPNDAVNSKKIGLIQKSLKVEKGKNYDKKAREDFEAGAFQTDAQKRKAQRSDGESHIDRDVRMNNPIYGAPDLQQGQELSATPNGKLDMSAKAQKDGTAQNYQLGWNYKSMLGLKSNHRSAKLYDKPNLPGATLAVGSDPTQNSAMTFETTAVSLEGPQKGTYYGSVEWGFTIDDATGAKLLPMKKLTDGAPTAKMKEVMENWNDGEFDTGKANPQIPIPK